MSSLVYRISGLLEQVVRPVPVGTNLGLFSLLFALLSGRLLASRGALLPALSDLGLDPPAVGRAAGAVSYGRFTVSDLLAVWQQQIEAVWQQQIEQEGRF